MGGLAQIGDKLDTEEIFVALALVGEEEKDSAHDADGLYEKKVHGDGYSLMVMVRAL